jgi:hypothetical protein
MVPTELKDALTIAVGIGGAVFGIITYMQNHILHEIILPLMKEFDESLRLTLAKYILKISLSME